MNMLHELGESLAPPGIAADDPRPPADLRRRVLTTAARDRRPRWTVRTRLAWQLGVVTAGALALAVMVAPHVYRTGTAPPHADSAPDAATVLQLAARSSAAAPAPARPDQYAFIESIRFMRVGIVPGPDAKHQSKLLGPHKTHTWWPADFTRDGYYKHLPPYCCDGFGTAKSGGGEKEPKEGPLGFEGTPPVLPTDADEMHAYLYRDDPEDVWDPAWSPDRRAWQRLVFGVMRQAFVNPAAQSAALGAAQRIGGVAVLEDAADVTGRPGIAVGRTEGNSRTELVFDPKTYAYLGYNIVWTEDQPDWGIKAGDIADGVAYTRTAFVDRVKQEP